MTFKCIPSFSDESAAYVFNKLVLVRTSPSTSAGQILFRLKYPSKFLFVHLHLSRSLSRTPLTFFRAPHDLSYSTHFASKLFKNLFDPPISVLCVSEADQFSDLV